MTTKNDNVSEIIGDYKISPEFNPNSGEYKTPEFLTKPYAEVITGIYQDLVETDASVAKTVIELLRSVEGFTYDEGELKPYQVVAAAIYQAKGHFKEKWPNAKDFESIVEVATLSAAEGFLRAGESDKAKELALPCIVDISNRYGLPADEFDLEIKPARVVKSWGNEFSYPELSLYKVEHLSQGILTTVVGKRPLMLQENKDYEIHVHSLHPEHYARVELDCSTSTQKLRFGVTYGYDVPSEPYVFKIELDTDPDSHTDAGLKFDKYGNVLGYLLPISGMQTAFVSSGIEMEGGSVYYNASGGNTEAYLQKMNSYLAETFEVTNSAERLLSVKDKSLEQIITEFRSVGNLQSKEQAFAALLRG